MLLALVWFWSILGFCPGQVCGYVLRAGGAGGPGDAPATSTPDEAELRGPDFIGCHHQEYVMENMAHSSMECVISTM